MTLDRQTERGDRWRSKKDGRIFEVVYVQRHTDRVQLKPAKAKNLKSTRWLDLWNLPALYERVDGDGALVAARFTVHLSAAVPDHEDGQGDVWDRIHEALDAIPGVFSEGGGSELMEDGDLIEHSPLDQYLKGANGA